MRFVRFSYYKTANRTAPCGVVRCDTILLAVRCGYAILQAVLVRFLRFDEHPYIQQQILHLFFLPFHLNILILLFLLSLSFTLSNFHLNNIYIFQCFHHRATVKCQICSKVLKF